jgi:hypothetical protein
MDWSRDRSLPNYAIYFNQIKETHIMSSKMRNSELIKLARTFRVPAPATGQAIFDYLSSLDCPRSLAVWLLYDSGEHMQLVDLDCHPNGYDSPFRFRDAYAATTFLSKANFLKLDLDCKEEAFKKFFQYEELCKQTNIRFSNLSSDPLYSGSNVWLLNATIRKIDQILGEYNAEEFVEGANWGPGVTTIVKGTDVSAVNKFHLENGITRDLYALVGSWFPAAYPLWSSSLRQNFGETWMSYQVGNSVITVPKNSKTDRVIAIEPGLNLWFQKSIGTMIRRRLQRHEIDLNSQVRNQQLAKLGSRDSSLATVDFSSASDSISRRLVEELLPPRWFSLLNATRSNFGIHNNSLIRWEKFSSMGNGFTFELESLIFFAAAKAVQEYLSVKGEISVFGDDVIIPKECYELFSSFSAFLGFKVNRKKSFNTTYFRESCGSHYFDGINCKPIFLKERLQNASAIFKLANGIRMLGHRRNSYFGCDSRFRHCWHRLVQRIPRSLRLWIPAGKGDGGFIVNFDEATPARARNGIEGYRYTCFAEVGLTRQSEAVSLLLARLKVISIQEFNNSYTLRGRTRLQLARSLAHQWYNIGEWV